MKTQSIIRRSLTLAALALPLTLTLSAPLTAQARVDLRSWQTPLKSQGSRGTCTTFSAVAALEAAYKRAGYGNLDLSEEFANYVVRMMLMHPNWDDTHPKTYGKQVGKMGPNFRENTPGNYGGGYGTAIAKRFRYISIPLETYMPYRPVDYDTRGYGSFEYQDNTNAFNLDTKNLPRRALNANLYYGAASVVELTSADSRNPAKMESLLRSGLSVMWTFGVGGTRPTNGIWQPDNSKLIGAHSMLIVGYDRRSSSSSQHYFLVKNSWGATGASTSEGGYTRISYNYLRRFGSSAGYVALVKKPAPWPELAFLGRRNISYDGFKGTLDIWRVPGVNRGLFGEWGIKYADRRLGNFIDHRGQIHRLNGELQGNRMVFWFNTKKPNIRWDELRLQDGTQHRFTYYLLDTQTGEIAGTQHRNAGTTPNPPYGGYARVPSGPNKTDGFVQRVAPPSSNKPEWFLGRWFVHFDGVRGHLNVNFRDDTLLIEPLRKTYAGMDCEYVEAGTNRRHKLIGYVLKSRPAQMWFSFRHPIRGTVSFTVYMHTYEVGAFGGSGSSQLKPNGIYGYRVGESVIAGKLSSIGLSCTGSNNRTPGHYVLGKPYLGNKLNYTLHSALPNAAALLVVGADLIDKGINLSIIGAKNCFLYTTPYAYHPVQCNSLGGGTYTWIVPNTRAAVGHGFTTQFASTDRKKNRLGLVTTNAYRTKLGGTR